MTSRPNARNRQQADREPEFDLVEDPGADDAAHEADFGRALDDLLPETGGPGVDIDLDDFEAFNRELDAQLEHARAPAGEPLEDLGVEVVEAASHPAPEVEHDWDDTTEEPVVTSEPDDEAPELAEDRVTLASRPADAAAAGAPAVERIKGAVANARAERASGAPAGLSPAASGEPEAAPAAESRSGRGGAIAVLLGLAGLAAGGAALWLTMERQAELERINATLAIRPDVVKAEPAPATVAGTEVIQALDARISAIRERITSLEAKTVEAAQNAAPAAALDQRLAELEAEIAALQDAQRPAAVTEPPAAPPAPAPTSTTAPIQTVEPPQPAAAAAAPVQQIEPAPREQPPAVAEKPAPAPVPAPETTAAKQPPAKPAEAKPKAPSDPAPAKAASRPLPTPDAGPWVVVVQSFTSEEAAEQRRAQVAGTGLPAEVRWVNINEKIWHRVIVPGYSSQEAARAAAGELGRRKLGSPWVLLLNRPE